MGLNQMEADGRIGGEPPMTTARCLPPDEEEMQRKPAMEENTGVG